MGSQMRGACQEPSPEVSLRAPTGRAHPAQGKGLLLHQLLTSERGPAGVRKQEKVSRIDSFAWSAGVSCLLGKNALVANGVPFGTIVIPSPQPSQGPIDNMTPHLHPGSLRNEETRRCVPLLISKRQEWAKLLEQKVKL